MFHGRIQTWVSFSRTFCSQLSVVNVPQVVVSTVTGIINRHVALSVIKQYSFILDFRTYKYIWSAVQTVQLVSGTLYIMITCQCCNIVVNVHISQNYSASTNFHEENFVRDFNPEGKDMCFKVVTEKQSEHEINNNNNNNNNNNTCI